MNTAALTLAGPSEPIPAPAQDPMLALIERAARDPSVDMDKMQRLMEMHRDMQKAAAERAFFGGMSVAQSEMTRVSADCLNPSTKSRYASYAQMDRALRPIYSRHGFLLTFNTEPEAAPEGSVRVTCLVAHADGHSRLYQIDMPADGKGARGNDVMTKTHAVGSAASYAQRYLLKMIFNVAVGEANDDGNAASVVNAERISHQQLDQLRMLADELNINVEAFCKRIKVNSLADIAADKFDAAIALMETKRPQA